MRLVWEYAEKQGSFSLGNLIAYGKRKRRVNNKKNAAHDLTKKGMANKPEGVIFQT